MLHTPPSGGDYAGGWMAVDRPWAGGKALTHSGSNTMWYCTIWLAPARDFGILVATNKGGDGAVKACDEASGELIRLAVERLESTGAGLRLAVLGRSSKASGRDRSGAGP